MQNWSALSGIYEGIDFTMYGEAAWNCWFRLEWDDAGMVKGYGYFTTGDDFAEEGVTDVKIDVVFLGQMTQKGMLYGAVVAPDRFDQGVCWAFNLDVDVDNRELSGGVLYSEDTLLEGEEGLMKLQYKHSLASGKMEG